MAQEKQAMALGLQMEENSAMITYYNSSMRDPVTPEPGDDREAAHSVPKMTPDIWKAACGMGRPIELLRDFLKESFEKILHSRDYSTVRIMVTVPKLEKLLAERIPQALMMLGVERRNIYLQDYLSSFYFYAVHQKKELWNADVALLEYRDQTMTGHVLHIEPTKPTAIARIELAGSQLLDDKARDGREDADWDKERDRLFFELLKKVFERRTVVTCYLIGDYFSQDWAVRSYQYLCQTRHVFQGHNLYTRGACYAAMERCQLARSQDILFLGADVLKENFHIRMRVRGREMDVPLISAGVNWYEAHHECEFIPDDQTSLTIWTKPMSGGEEVAHLMRLRRFPARNNRATRLRMTMYFTSPDCCCVEVEDLGFGGFYRSTGQKWKRKIYL